MRGGTDRVPAAGSRRRAGLLLAVRGAITIAVLAAIFAVVPFHDMTRALARISWQRFALVLAGMIALHAVNALKWRMFVQATGVRCTAMAALRAHFAGLFSNLFLPGLVATDVVRATMLARSGTAVAPVAVGSVADRLVDTGSLVVLGVLGAAFVRGGEVSWATPIAVALALVAGGLAAAPMLRWLRGDRFPEAVRGLADKLETSRAALVRRPGVALAAGLLSVALQAGMVLLAVWLGVALGIDVPLAVWFFAWPLAKLVILVPLTISGLGVREAALAGLLLPFGVEPAVAIVLGLVWQSVQAALALVGGAFAYGSGSALRRGGASAESGEGNAAQATHEEPA